MENTDHILLSFTTLCNIGITEEEKSKKQQINITIKLFVKNDYNKLDDNIKNVIDYNLVHKKIKQLAENSRFSLIETLASKIAEMLENINHKSLKKAKIEINKPNAILDANVSFIMDKTL